MNKAMFPYFYKGKYITSEMLVNFQIPTE